MLVRFASSTRMPTVEERVQLLAPRARVTPVGAEPYLEIEPRALVALAVPVPEVVPPRLSIVTTIELSIVPVMVAVADAVGAGTANELPHRANAIAHTRSAFL